MNYLDSTIKKYRNLIEGKMSLIRSFVNEEEPTVNCGGLVLKITDKYGSTEIIDDAREVIQDYFDKLRLISRTTELEKEYFKLKEQLLQLEI
jgi:hypothetical protein